MTEYFCYCWRDAIDDPPTDPKWWGFLREKSTGRMYLGQVLPAGSKVGMEWMDLTNIPAIPREQVQAAVKEMRGEPPWGCDTWEHAVDILEAHTGIDFTPSVVKESLTTEIEGPNA